MLDENLPTFHIKPSSDNANFQSVIYFSQNGSEPTPEYIFTHADPAIHPQARRHYAVALCDPYAPDVVYGEVILAPEWVAPSLSAAEIKAQAQQQQQNGGGGEGVGETPSVPESFVIQLHSPEQQIIVRYIPGSWNRSEVWEFDVVTQSFRMPSASQLDRLAQNGSPATGGTPPPPTATPAADDRHSPALAAPDLRPKLNFKWKKDGKLTKDMTCFHTGKSVGRHKSKEPDITIGMFKASAGGKRGEEESAVTVYEPNMQRVEVEDRKGLEIVLVLGAEVIKELWLSPRLDAFNLGNGAGVASTVGGGGGGGRRKNSRPTPPASGHTSSAAIPQTSALSPAPTPHAGNPSPFSAAVPSHTAHTSSARPPPIPTSKPTNSEIDAETKRLQAIVNKERKEREKKDREEQKRIQKMLDDEERDRQKREREVEKETERLRKLYGVQGQTLSPNAAAGAGKVNGSGAGRGNGGGHLTSPPQPPPRPVSAGPYHTPSPSNNPYNQPYRPQAPNTSVPPPAQNGPGGGSFFSNPTLKSWWQGPSGVPMPQVGGGPQQMYQQPPPPQQQQPQQQPPGQASGSGGGGLRLFHKRDDGRRVAKKRSL